MRSIKLIFCWVERPSIEISALLMFFSLWFCLIVPRGKHKGNISELPWEKDIMKFASRVTATFTGPRQISLFPKTARPAAPCATYCYASVGLLLKRSWNKHCGRTKPSSNTTQQRQQCTPDVSEVWHFRKREFSSDVWYCALRGLRLPPFVHRVVFDGQVASTSVNPSFAHSRIDRFNHSVRGNDFRRITGRIRP